MPRTYVALPTGPHRNIAEKTKVNYDWLATGRGTIEPPPSQQASYLAARIERASPEVRRYIDALLTVAENIGANHANRLPPLSNDTLR